MAQSSLSLRDAIARGNAIWLYDKAQDRGLAVEWMENGSKGNGYPQMVLRIGRELGVSNKDAACLVRLLDDHKSLDFLTRSADVARLPFSVIWIWEKANALYWRRQYLNNAVSRIDEKIMKGYWHSDDELVGGLLSKLTTFEAFAGYYMVTGGAAMQALHERMTEVWLATEWNRGKTLIVARTADDEANFWAAKAANAVFQRVLQHY